MSKLNIPDNYWSETVTLDWLISLHPIALPHELLFDVHPYGKVAVRKKNLELIIFQSVKWHTKFPQLLRTKAQFLSMLYGLDPDMYNIRKYVTKKQTG